MSKSFTVSKGILLASLLFFLMGVGGSLDDPVATDQVDLLVMARHLNEVGKPFSMIGKLIIWSPPLYLACLAMLFRIFGESGMVARLFGIACTLGTAWLTYFLSREIWRGKNKQIPAIAVSLFLTNPAVVQGSLWVDIDPTLLTFTVTLFLLFLVREGQTLTFGGAIKLGGLFCLTLWSKLSTPFFVIGSFLFHSLFSRGRLKHLSFALLLFLSGLLFFIVSWLVVCWIVGFPVLDPLFYALRKTAATAPRGTGVEILPGFGLRLLRVALWFSPTWLLLCLVSLCEVIKRRSLGGERGEGRQILGLFVFSLFFVYVLFETIHFGYPKYLIPLIPAAISLIAGLIPELRFSARQSLLTFFILVLGFLAFFVGLGDPLLDVNFKLREAMIQGGPAVGIVFREGMKKAFIFFASLFIFFFLCRTLLKEEGKKGWILSLLILTFSYNLSVGFHQMRAPYLTGAAYGERGMAEAIAFLKKETPSPGVLLAPMDFIYYLDGKFPHVHYHRWGTAEALLKELHDQKVKGLVTSPAHNSIRDFTQSFHTEEVRAVLQRHFYKKEIGTITIWLRSHERKR